MISYTVIDWLNSAVTVIQGQQYREVKSLRSNELAVKVANIN